jgi:Flp pilus assembly pilin Flp
MIQWVKTFCVGEEGQDLIEYSLLITFIAIACAALIGSGRSAVNSIWISSNSDITQGYNAATGGS